MKKLVLLVLLLLIGGVMAPAITRAKPEILVEFPQEIPLTVENLPVKISIPDPQAFGYSRVPVSIKVAVAGYREHGIEIPLKADLTDSQAIYNKPIEVNVLLPLPIKKIGFYRLVVDIKCLYGPSYRKNSWYSYTDNKLLQVTAERIRIVSGPQIEYKPTDTVGYLGRSYGTIKTDRGFIEVVDVISNGVVIDKVSLIRSAENEIQKVISSSNLLWKPEKYEVFLGNTYSFWRLRKFIPYGKYYGYTFSESVRYDWERKGISYTFKVQVVSRSNNKILYEEPAAVVGTAFSEEDITREYIEKEKKELQQKYRFLLNQFPDAELLILFERGEAGKWRWLFGVQPPQWVAEHGIVVEAPLPLTEGGEPFIPGLNEVKWPGMRWNPVGEFQLEVLPSN